MAAGADVKKSDWPDVIPYVSCRIWNTSLLKEPLDVKIGTMGITVEVISEIHTDTPIIIPFTDGSVNKCSRIGDLWVSPCCHTISYHAFPVILGIFTVDGTDTASSIARRKSLTASLVFPSRASATPRLLYAVGS